jgi:hypothetical protein
MFPPTHRPAAAMLSRTPLISAPPAPLPVGDWPAQVPWQALDWTGKTDADPGTPIDIEFCVDPSGAMTMVFPSAVRARLSPVGDGVYRVGRMPEETTVRFEGGAAHIDRRVGAERVAYPCSIRAES